MAAIKITVLGSSMRKLFISGFDSYLYNVYTNL